MSIDKTVINQKRFHLSNVPASCVDCRALLPETIAWQESRVLAFMAVEESLYACTFRIPAAGEI